MTLSILIQTYVILPAHIMVLPVFVPNLQVQSQIRQGTITGQVTDATTDEALHFANVFLASTALKVEYNKRRILSNIGLSFSISRTGATQKMGQFRNYYILQDQI